MALTKDKKQAVIADVAQLLQESKLTVVAKYAGTGVKAMQGLRRSANASGSVVKVVKNRLVIQALTQVPHLKNIDSSLLKGQLLYTFNPIDEVAPAQNLAAFAKSNPQLEFVGAITADGSFLNADEVKSLAALPSKDQLRAQLVSTIAAPLSGFVNVVTGNLRGVLNVLDAYAKVV